MYNATLNTLAAVATALPEGSSTMLRGAATAAATMAAAIISTATNTSTPNNGTEPGALGGIHIDAGGIGGISVGGLLGAVAVGACCFWVCKRCGAGDTAAAAGAAAGAYSAL